jgi:hypothetical protein
MRGDERRNARQELGACLAVYRERADAVAPVVDRHLDAARLVRFAGLRAEHELGALDEEDPGPLNRSDPLGECGDDRT